MNRLVCHECGAPATHEDLLARSRVDALPALLPQYLCRHAAVSRDPATVRRLTMKDYGIAPRKRERVTA
jgi:hypothetical protein